jgi:hypothetical protein
MKTQVSENTKYSWVSVAIVVAVAIILLVATSCGSVGYHSCPTYN